MRALGRHHGHGWEGLEEQRLWKKKRERRNGGEDSKLVWKRYWSICFKQRGQQDDSSDMTSEWQSLCGCAWAMSVIGLLNILHGVQNIQYFHQGLLLSGHVHYKQQKKDIVGHRPCCFTFPSGCKLCGPVLFFSLKVCQPWAQNYLMQLHFAGTSTENPFSPLASVLHVKSSVVKLAIKSNMQRRTQDVSGAPHVSVGMKRNLWHVHCEVGHSITRGTLKGTYHIFYPTRASRWALSVHFYDQEGTSRGHCSPWAHNW